MHSGRCTLDLQNHWAGLIKGEDTCCLGGSVWLGPWRPRGRQCSMYAWCQIVKRLGPLVSTPPGSRKQCSRSVWFWSLVPKSSVTIRAACAKFKRSLSQDPREYHFNTIKEARHYLQSAQLWWWRKFCTPTSCIELCKERLFYDQNVNVWPAIWYASADPPLDDYFSTHGKISYVYCQDSHLALEHAVKTSNFWMHVCRLGSLSACPLVLAGCTARGCWGRHEP